MDLDQLQPSLAADLARENVGMNGLDQRRLAHAARAPEQGVVGRQALGEPLGVGGELVADAVDALEQRQVDAVDLLHRVERAARGAPDESVGGVEIGGGRRRRRKAVERVGDAGEKVVLVGRLVGHGAGDKGRAAPE